MCVCLCVCCVCVGMHVFDCICLRVSVSVCLCVHAHVCSTHLWTLTVCVPMLCVHVYTQTALLWACCECQLSRYLPSCHSVTVLPFLLLQLKEYQFESAWRSTLWEKEGDYTLPSSQALSAPSFAQCIFSGVEAIRNRSLFQLEQSIMSGRYAIPHISACGCT